MLLERFRRPRWQHPDPAVRRQEVARLTPQDPEQERRLRVLALEDSDDSVRAVATKRLDDLAVLRRISEAESASEVREAASLRFRQLLAGGIGDDGGLEQRVAELDKVTDSAILAHVVRNAREERMRSAALDRIEDAGVIEQVALNDELFRMRQAALIRLTDVEVLDRVAEQARAIDRRIARMARERAEERRQEEAERQRRVTDARQLCEQARELVDRPVLQGTEHAEAERLRNRWQGLGELPDRAPRDRFRVLMDRLDARLAEAQTADPEVAERLRSELDDALQAIEASDEPESSLLERIASALEALPASAETRQSRAREWLEAGQRYLEHRETLLAATDEAALHNAVEAIAWPAGLPEPAPLARARAAEGEAEAPEAMEIVDDLDAVDGEATEVERTGESDGVDGTKRAASLAKLAARLDELDQALAEDQYRPASRALKAARAEADKIGGDLPEEHERRLTQGRARLAELEDWWRFAVLPKQRDLCERMEALVDDDELSPPERAQRIRELRNEWRRTGEGHSGEARELRERFNAAAEQAFQPCREYYQREAERRRANLAARERVTEQLASFLDQTELGDIATEELERIRDTARSDWKAASPVDRDAVAELSERFEGLMDQLTAVIDERRQAARDRKQALVDEVKALTSWQDVEAATERAKELQAAWEPAGTTWPSVERGLARAFRSACDHLFEAREAERAARRERNQAAIDDAERVCAHMEALAEVTDTDGESVAERIRSLRQAFDAVQLPNDRVGKALRHRFERAESAANNRRRQLHSEGENAAVRQVLDHLAAGGSVEALPANAPAELKGALTTVEVPSEEDAAERRRVLCVRLEIRAGLDSPAADEELRMRQQIDRLADGMAGSGEAGVDPWQCLAEWIVLGGAPVEAERDRVYQAMTTILGEASR